MKEELYKKLDQQTPKQPLLNPSPPPAPKKQNIDFPTPYNERKKMYAMIFPKKSY